MTAVVANSPRTGRRAGLSCPDCGRRLQRSRLQEGSNTCPQCSRQFQARIFTPLRRRGHRAAPVADQSTPACGNHAGNAATESCTACGMFICRLCVIAGDDEQLLCPGCFDRLNADGALLSTRTTLTNYGLLTLNLGLVTILFWPTAPISAIFGIATFVKNTRQNSRLGERIGRTMNITGLILIILGALLSTFIWLAMVGYVD